MIKYLGSKRLLLPAILDLVGGLAHENAQTRSVLDLFSGTSRVGHALKKAGFRVLANDHNAYAATLAGCYVAADREAVERDATRLIDEFSRLPGRDGWFTDTYARRSRFFREENAARIEAIRDAIEAKALPPELRAVMLVSLMEAADRVDSTTGVQMAYLKAWAARANKHLTLRMPDVLPRAVAGKGEAHQRDALHFVADVEVDIAYLDPPYNSHKYRSNYHIWETLVRWDQPEVYGIACKRIDCRDGSSPFNTARGCLPAMAHIIRSVRARHLVVSFNNEGRIARKEMVALLEERGAVEVIEHDYKRYVGAQIGIHSPAGKKVGIVSHLRNVEYIFVVRNATPICAGR